MWVCIVVGGFLSILIEWTILRIENDFRMERSIHDINHCITELENSLCK
jgi:hypothetical protein